MSLLCKRHEAVFDIKFDSIAENLSFLHVVYRLDKVYSFSTKVLLLLPNQLFASEEASQGEEDWIWLSSLNA